MGVRTGVHYTRLPGAALPILALLLDGCGGTSRALPHQAPVDHAMSAGNLALGDSNDASGATEEDVRRIISELKQQGRTPNYVTVKVGSATHYFSPNDLVMRTDKALAVQTPRRLYVWSLSRKPTIRYSGWSWDIATSEIPYTPSKLADDGIDAALQGKLRKNPTGSLICNECDVLFGRKAVPNTPRGPAVTDPWQVDRRGASSGQRGTSAYIVCVYDVNGAHCSVYDNSGAWSMVAPGYYYSAGGGDQGPVQLPPPPCPVTLPSADLQKAFDNRPDIQAVAQAIASRNTNHAPPHIYTQSPPPGNANGVGALTTSGNTTSIFFPDNYGTYFNAGINLADILLHELLHMWYETKGSDGYRPNPLPGNPGFNAHPTVQFNGTDSQTGAATTVTVQFDIIDQAGHFDAKQYAAYEHVLIHDDAVWGTGSDGVWTSITDAMQGASSVRVGDGTASKIDGTTAVTIMSRYGLQSTYIANRGPRNAPSWPDYYAGCQLSTTSVARQPSATGRSLPSTSASFQPPRASIFAARPSRGGLTTSSSARRRSSLDDPIVRYNLDGYDLIWDGVPLPPPPAPLPTCTPDPKGNCAVELGTEQYVAQCSASSGGSTFVLWKDRYLVYTWFGTQQYYALGSFLDDNGEECGPLQRWDPVEPQLDLGDTWLP